MPPQGWDKTKENSKGPFFHHCWLAAGYTPSRGEDDATNMSGDDYPSSSDESLGDGAVRHSMENLQHQRVTAPSKTQLAAAICVPLHSQSSSAALTV